MSRPSDAFHSELDYLWRAVGEAQDASVRSEAERADARKGLLDVSAKALRLERQLAESMARERRLKAETENLKISIKKESEGAPAERETSLKASPAASEGELSGLHTELAHRSQELAALEAALSEAVSKERISAAEKAPLEGRIADFKAALSEKEAALKNALSDCAALRAELNASGFETERLRQAADEQSLRAQEQRSHFSGAVAQVFGLQKRAADLKSALGQAQERNVALAGELKARQADMETVNSLLRNAKNSLALEKEITRRAGIKIKSLEGEIETLRTKITASADYAARILKAVENRDLQITGLRTDLKKTEELELENEDLRRKNIKFSGFLKREQTDFNTRMITALERAVKDLKTFNLRMPDAGRKNLEPAMKNLLTSVNLLKGWQEYLDPETPELEDTELAGFVSGETGKWERAFRQRKISISTAVLNPRLRAPLSAERMKILFYQLIKNAYERLQQGGSLRVTLKGAEDGRHAAIRFEDSGPGFSQEALSKLYAPFNTTEKGHAGIGLAVALRIAEKHGGTLEVSNKKERGAVVEVLLPLAG